MEMVLKQYDNGKKLNIISGGRWFFLEEKGIYFENE